MKLKAFFTFDGKCLIFKYYILLFRRVHASFLKSALFTDEACTLQLRRVHASEKTSPMFSKYHSKGPFLACDNF